MKQNNSSHLTTLVAPSPLPFGIGHTLFPRANDRFHLTPRREMDDSQSTLERVKKSVGRFVTLALKSACLAAIEIAAGRAGVV